MIQSSDGVFMDMYNQDDVLMLFVLVGFHFVLIPILFGKKHVFLDTISNKVLLC